VEAAGVGAGQRSLGLESGTAALVGGDVRVRPTSRRAAGGRPAVLRGGLVRVPACGRGGLNTLGGLVLGSVSRKLVHASKRRVVPVDRDLAWCTPKYRPNGALWPWSGATPQATLAA
jgi:hypothetical protein